MTSLFHSSAKDLPRNGTKVVSRIFWGGDEEAAKVEGIRHVIVPPPLIPCSLTFSARNILRPSAAHSLTRFFSSYLLVKILGNFICNMALCLP